MLLVVKFSSKTRDVIIGEVSELDVFHLRTIDSYQFSSSVSMIYSDTDDRWPSILVKWYNCFHYILTGVY